MRKKKYIKGLTESKRCWKAYNSKYMVELLSVLCIKIKVDIFIYQLGWNRGIKLSSLAIVFC